MTPASWARYDNTGGPRGQLAAHPAVAQFLLDNAANVERAMDRNLQKPERERCDGVTGGWSSQDLFQWLGWPPHLQAIKRPLGEEPYLGDLPTGY